MRRKFLTSIKIFLFLTIAFGCLFACTSCTSTSVKYVESSPDLTDAVGPVFDTRPAPPEIITDVESLSDVMNNSASWQMAYYQMSDYATSLEQVIKKVLVMQN